MKRTTASSLFTFAVLAFLAQGGLASVRSQYVPESRVVTITLHSEATVDDTIVTLDQIAKLTGGSPALRKRLGKLDVIDFPSSATNRVVSSELVRFRLLLAGLDAAEFHMSGARRTTIAESDEPVTFRRLLAVAENAVRTRYPGNGAGTAMSAAKGVVIPLLETHPTDRIRYEAVVKGAVPLRGRVGVDVALLVNGKKREVVTVFMDIATPTAAVKAYSDRDQPIRPAANWTPGPAPFTFAIKAKDNVKLIVSVGAGARIEMMGEALEDGRLGQVIRVRNPDSNRVVQGRVEARGIVAVDP